MRFYYSGTTEYGFLESGYVEAENKKSAKQYVKNEYGLSGVSICLPSYDYYDVSNIPPKSFFNGIKDDIIYFAPCGVSNRLYIYMIILLAILIIMCYMFQLIPAPMFFFGVLILCFYYSINYFSGVSVKFEKSNSTLKINKTSCFGLTKSIDFVSIIQPQTIIIEQRRLVSSGALFNLYFVYLETNSNKILLSQSTVRKSEYQFAEKISSFMNIPIIDNGNNVINHTAFEMYEVKS